MCMSECMRVQSKDDQRIWRTNEHTYIHMYICICVYVCVCSGCWEGRRGAKAPQLELKRVKGTRAVNNQSNSLAHTHTLTHMHVCTQCSPVIHSVQHLFLHSLFSALNSKLHFIFILINDKMDIRNIPKSY